MGEMGSLKIDLKTCLGPIYQTVIVLESFKLLNPRPRTLDDSQIFSLDIVGGELLETLGSRKITFPCRARFLKTAKYNDLENALQDDLFAPVLGKSPDFFL